MWGLLDDLYVGERPNVTSSPRGHCLKGSHRSAVGLLMQGWLGLVDLRAETLPVAHADATKRAQGCVQISGYPSSPARKSARTVLAE